MPANALPPLFANTTTDQSAPPVVLGYIGASITILVAIIRVGLTIKKQHSFSADDFSFLAGAALAVATSITLERAVDEGLGRHSEILTHAQLNSYTKYIYATSLLSIFAQSGAKLSVAFLFERLAPRQDEKGIALLLSCIGAWILFAVFGTAFACEGKVYWGAQCQADGWIPFPIIITNFITDAMLAVWMIPRIWKLQASKHDRLLTAMLMGLRILVCLAELGQLGYVAKLRSISTSTAQNEADLTWNSAMIWTITISVVHLSIITATIPRINSFIADVQTRRAGLALTQKDYENYKSSKDGSNNASKGGSKTGSRNWSRSRDPGLGGVLSSFRPDRTVERTNNFGTTNGDEIEMDVRDTIETGSQSSLQRNAVYQKTEFRWEEEYAPGNPSGVKRH